MMADKPFAPYAERNSAPILNVLRVEFAHVSRVLEIGSGTGQHAACFAAALRHLDWHTSDLEENHAGISAWVEDAALANLHVPLLLDMRDAQPVRRQYDGVFSANTAHIMSMKSVKNMFAFVAGSLQDDGVFCLYGPFRQNGEFNTPSNAAFHESLMSRDPDMGIRDLVDLDAEGERHGLRRRRLYAMPANNHVAVWTRRAR